MSGMVAFAADSTAEAPELASQDAYFMKHWWGMMVKYILGHAGAASSMSSTADGSGSATGSGTKRVSNAQIISPAPHAEGQPEGPGGLLERSGSRSRRR